MIMTDGSRSIQRKPCPSATLFTINATSTDLVSKPGFCYLCVSMCIYIYIYIYVPLYLTDSISIIGTEWLKLFKEIMGVLWSET